MGVGQGFELIRLVAERIKNAVDAGAFAVILSGNSEPGRLSADQLEAVAVRLARAP